MAPKSDHVTLQGAQAIREADLILIPRKGENKADLAGLREEIIAKVTEMPPQIAYFDIPKRRSDDGYLQGVDEWHDAIALRWQEAMAEHSEASKIALLIWGIPRFTTARFALPLGWTRNRANA